MKEKIDRSVWITISMSSPGATNRDRRGGSIGELGAQEQTRLLFEGIAMERRRCLAFCRHMLGGMMRLSRALYARDRERAGNHAEARLRWARRSA